MRSSGDNMPTRPGNPIAFACLKGIGNFPHSSTLAAALAFASTPVQAQAPPLSCMASADESPWLAESYRDTHTYGLDDGEWIESYGGLAAAGDSLFLYDRLRPRIVHLSGELEERQAFGRSGEGPGEFHLSWPIRWLDDLFEGYVDFDGRRVVVYDRLRLASFDAGGEYEWSARVPNMTVLEGVQFVVPVGEEQMIFGMDSVDAGGRHLQLWSSEPADPDHLELLWERPVPRHASDDRFPGITTREARSQWARHQDCVVVSDGGGRLLWVVDLPTMQTDSIALPEWEVPAFGELSIDRGTLNLGGREVQPERPSPALLWRWRGLIVDPDGHAWVRAWTESRKEFEVFVVSLATGESRRFSPPGFPTAFGLPGVFYTAREHPETDEHHIVRLVGERR